MKIKFSFFCVLLLVLSSCDDDYVPKPKAFLRLDYPKATYKKTKLPKMPVAFEMSSLVNNVTTKTISGSTESYGANLEYKPLKATLFLTYKGIHKDKTKLKDFLIDAQKLTLEHTKKADEIPVYPYENKERRVYGKLSEVKGDAASLVQFYVTDSVNHFLTGSLYFNVKPNYDSILPAADYLQKDIQRIIETLEWQ
ncbi:gliding motility lipoprotein GldD [Algibacter sp. 2305UL17-15]|uniref:gliding motility lipoprotein GldD n=1 Tax=Algibacter sp. 2305UL17-15 TaxID=3231268 RepID=UPI00345B2DC5